MLEHYRETAVERGAAAEADWEQRAAAYREEHADAWEELSLVMEGRLPDGWDAEPPRFQPDDGPVATRKASSDVIQWAAAQVPHLISGSADLEPSTLTEIDGGGSVAKGDYTGRNVHYGVREHGMTAIVNGLVLHGLRAFGSTFFNFSDYLKGALRMAAIMELPAIVVFTHDSIGLGEDGPTHQPIEQLAHLRATPNLYMVRPSDANETALAWRFAIGQTEVPVAFALSRQGLPIWSPDDVPEDAIHRGAYVLRDSSKDGDPDLILIGTGSEVSICAEAAELLEADGIATRVVSAPCLERFDEQDDDYRDAVLPPSVRARVSVEAAATLGWERWTTDDGDQVGMTSFGASAPQPELYEHFGFTAENVAARGTGGPRATGGTGMSVGAQVNPRLAALTAAGTSVWLDQIRRSLIESGELERLVRDDSLRGVTSNPAIFEKAILGSSDYDEQIAELAGEGLDAKQIYEEIAITDVQLACDVLRGVWDEAGGADGFVSLEVEPGFAHDADATLAQARDFWERVDRPNLMIKIPGTEEGVPAIEQAISEGINVNVTLLFSVESYTAIAEAYIRGMERRLEAGEPLNVHSVASFFVSRVDTEVDKRLAERLGPARRRRDRQRARRLREVQGAVPRRALRAAARGRLPGAAPAVGVDRREGPALPGDQVRRLAGRRRTPSTRCRCRRCWPARSSSR